MSFRLLAQSSPSGGKITRDGGKHKPGHGRDEAHLECRKGRNAQKKARSPIREAGQRIMPVAGKNH
jgi:hypothetical protein